MLYLIWTLINVALFLYFIFICFQATKLLKEKLGGFVAIIFVFGLLSFVTRANSENPNQEPNSTHFKTWKFDTSTRNSQVTTEMLTVTLESNLTNEFLLNVKSSKNPDTQTTSIVEASTNTSGLVGGIVWAPNSVLINTTNDPKKVTYHVTGDVNWTLLGMTIFSVSKEWSGDLSLK